MVRARRRSTTFSDCSSGILGHQVAGTTDYEQEDQQRGLLVHLTSVPYVFYLWRHLKSTFRATEVSEVQDLHQRIQRI